METEPSWLYGIAVFIVGVAALVLIVLAILMPYFAYRGAGYARECRDEIRKMNKHYTDAVWAKRVAAKRVANKRCRSCGGLPGATCGCAFTGFADKM